MSLAMVPGLVCSYLLVWDRGSLQKRFMRSPIFFRISQDTSLVSENNLPFSSDAREGMHTGTRR
jgi:hypothetical protein